VTRNAVLGVPEQKVKVSLRSLLMLPQIALVGPELTYSLPPHVTASTGLDALTQVLEPYVSNQPNPLTDGFCLEGMRRASRSLRRAYENGQDAQARLDMSLASLLGGLALANARLGAVHGFAAPIGGMFPAPHGAVCARLLPVVMQVNLKALRERDPGGESMKRYQEVARVLTGDPGASPEDGAAWVTSLCNALDVPPLRMYGIGAVHIPDLVERAAQASSMRGNPIKLTTAELETILDEAI
jgi:alcohol dehydrogenase class IV